MGFIVLDTSANRGYNAVVAPTGYYRRSDGTISRDWTPSPEMGPREYAYIFRTHRSAAIVASRLANPRIADA